MQERRYPVGIQTLKDIIEGNYLYIDKTGLVYDLCQRYKCVFLSRPRRFGKSLLVSTLKEYFSGNRELFSGLKISELEKEWIEYPVLQFNMSSLKRDTVEEIKQGMGVKLDEYEAMYGITEKALNINDRLTILIRRAHEKTGHKVVILIDEYDAPLLNVIYEENMNAVRHTLRSFYSPIKDCDEHIQFAFMTGITKFSQLSIFSELNNLAKISLDDDYSAICGITQAEIDTCMHEDIELLSEKLKLTYDETHAQLKQMYDGYHFSADSEDIYNPFSLLSCFAAGRIKNFWFDSATPSFLIKAMKKFNFRINETEKLECQEEQFDVSATDLESAIPLLYQSGYLTIKGYEPRFRKYFLNMPNDEVRYGLMKSLIPSVFCNSDQKNDFWIDKFVTDIEEGNLESFMERLEALVMSVPYATGDKAELVTEQSVQNAFFLIFNLMGQFTRAEVHTLKGRSDCIVETSDAVYLFEFKLSKNGTAAEALAQIGDKSYACSFEPSSKKIVKVGVAFNSASRTFDQYVTEIR